MKNKLRINLSKENKLAIKISIILLIFAILITYFIQYFNHHFSTTIKGKGYTKYYIFPILSIFIYIVAYILAKITIKPIEDANEKLKSYNHNIAHELKTPMSIISSNLELIELKYDKNLIKSSLEEINNMRDITDSLLFLSENNKLKDIEKVSIKDIVEKYDVNIKLISDFVLKGNKVLLERLVFNLVENALKYKKEKTNIDVYLDKNIFKISNKIDQKIDLVQTKILFDAFYKIDSSRNTSGYGLGLSIVKKICDLHNLIIDIKIKDDIFCIIIQK